MMNDNNNEIGHLFLFTIQGKIGLLNR